MLIFAILRGLGRQYTPFTAGIDTRLASLTFQDVISHLRSHTAMTSLHHESRPKRDFPPMANLGLFDPQGADRRRGKTTTDQDEAAADRSIVLLIVTSVCATRIATMSAASDSVVISSPDPAKNSGKFAPREQNSYTYLANSAPRIKELRMQPAFTKLQNMIWAYSETADR